MPIRRSSSTIDIGYETVERCFLKLLESGSNLATPEVVRLFHFGVFASSPSLIYLYAKSTNVLPGLRTPALPCVTLRYVTLRCDTLPVPASLSNLESSSAWFLQCRWRRVWSYGRRRQNRFGEPTIKSFVHFVETRRRTLSR